MKRSVSPWVITGIVIAAVVLLLFVAKQTLFQDPDYSPIPWEQTRAYKEQQRMHTQGQQGQQEPPGAAAVPNSQQPSSHPRGALAGGS